MQNYNYTYWHTDILDNSLYIIATVAVKMAKTRDLFAACRDGKLQTVQRLVQSKKVFPSAAVDERYNDFTALHHAAA